MDVYLNNTPRSALTLESAGRRRRGARLPVGRSRSEDLPHAQRAEGPEARRLSAHASARGRDARGARVRSRAAGRRLRDARGARPRRARAPVEPPLARRRRLEHRGRRRVHAPRRCSLEPARHERRRGRSERRQCAVRAGHFAPVAHRLRLDAVSRVRVHGRARAHARPGSLRQTARLRRRHRLVRVERAPLLEPALRSPVRWSAQGAAHAAAPRRSPPQHPSQRRGAQGRRALQGAERRRPSTLRPRVRRRRSASPDACAEVDAVHVRPRARACGVPRVPRAGTQAHAPCASPERRCTARVIFSTEGRVLEATMRGGARYVYEEQGRVRREDGSLVLDGGAPLGTRFAIDGAFTWSGDRHGRLTRIHNGRTVERASTGVRGTDPVFTSTYRLEQEWVVEHSTGSRVGQILEGQTCLWSGERLGLGFYRLEDLTHVFLLRSGKSGLLPVRGTIGVIQGRPGRRGLRLRRRSCCSRSSPSATAATSRRCGSSTRPAMSWGRAKAAARVARCCAAAFCAPPTKVCSFKNDNGVLVEGTLFPDSRAFVGAHDTLLPQPDGSLVVAESCQNEIVHLSLS